MVNNGRYLTYEDYIIGKYYVGDDFKLDIRRCRDGAVDELKEENERKYGKFDYEWDVSKNEKIAKKVNITANIVKILGITVALCAISFLSALLFLGKPFWVFWYILFPSAIFAIIIEILKSCFESRLYQYTDNNVTKYMDENEKWRFMKFIDRVDELTAENVRKYKDDMIYREEQLKDLVLETFLYCECPTCGESVNTEDYIKSGLINDVVTCYRCKSHIGLKMNFVDISSIGPLSIGRGLCVVPEVVNIPRININKSISIVDSIINRSSIVQKEDFTLIHNMLDWSNQPDKEKEFFMSCMNGEIDMCPAIEDNTESDIRKPDISNVNDPEKLYDIAVEVLKENRSDELVISIYNKALNNNLSDDYGGDERETLATMRYEMYDFDAN